MKYEVIKPRKLKRIDSDGHGDGISLKKDRNIELAKSEFMQGRPKGSSSDPAYVLGVDAEALDEECFCEVYLPRESATEAEVGFEGDDVPSTALAAAETELSIIRKFADFGVPANRGGEGAGDGSTRRAIAPPKTKPPRKGKGKGSSAVGEEGKRLDGSKPPTDGPTRYCPVVHCITDVA